MGGPWDHPFNNMLRKLQSSTLLERYSTVIIFLIPTITIFTLFVVLPVGKQPTIVFTVGMVLVIQTNTLD